LGHPVEDKKTAFDEPLNDGDNDYALCNINISDIAVTTQHDATDSTDYYANQHKTARVKTNLNAIA